MMRIFLTISAILVTIISNAMPTLKWQSLGNCSDENGAYYIQRLSINGSTGVERLCFNQFARKMHTLTDGDTINEIIPGYYYLTSPRFGEDSVVIDIRTRGQLNNVSYRPDGFHAVMKDGKVIPVEFTYESISSSPEMWQQNGKDRMPYGDAIYKFNETLKTNDKLGAFDIIPSFKSVTPTKKGYCQQAIKPIVKHITHDNYEFYRITINTDNAIIEAASEQAEKMARMALMKLWHRNNGKIPTAIIEDYPDFHYRGVLIDISRNNQPLETLENIAFKLAQYRMNKLHFHFCDDEAWRLEIPSFPELTQIGSRRGYTLDEKEYLVQIFAGNGNPDETKGTSNGYITRQQFVEFLKKCNALGIDVIPEIESPGHARAAIKAMEARYRRTGDPIYRLIEDGDTSKYTSAQAFHDNVMNPALDGPINFMRTVIGEIISMYKDAGAELTAIHIGGDEVPDGAWNGSPSAQALIKEKNLDGEKGLHAYFVKQIANILAERGIPMNGWQEIAIGHSDEYNADVAPLTGGVNSWTVFNPKAPIDKHVSVQALKAGYPIILSNVNHFYLDQSYNYHPDEPGLTWGGVVDEFASLNGYPAKMCPVPDELKDKIIGLSGQVFAETLRSPAQLESYLFPKMFGLAERAWNADETYSNAHFNKLIAEKELPAFGNDCNFHLRQPGIISNKGTIKMNSPYEKAVIRYTLDGSEPTIDSSIYTKPIKTDAKEIRARLYYLGKESVTTILYL